MAGDWIKMRTNLWDDPRVARICDLTEQSEAAVVGGLYWLWSMADAHTEDGILPGLTLRAINRKTGLASFAEALVRVGWLKESDDGVCIVGFEEHNGASAKRRCQTAKRVANHGSTKDCEDKKRSTNAPLTHEALAIALNVSFDALAREEKRREELKNSVPNGTGGKPPGLTSKEMLWSQGIPLLIAAGVPEKNARSMLGGLCRAHGDEAVARVVADCAAIAPIEPVSWMQSALKVKVSPGAKRTQHTGFDTKDYKEGVNEDGTLV